MILKLKDGDVKIELFPDVAPNHVNRIKELANKIKNIINPKLDIIYQPLPEDDPLKRKPDISKAIEELSWKPKINLENGINLTIDWFKKAYF